jgi:hypothetical protein
MHAVEKQIKTILDSAESDEPRQSNKSINSGALLNTPLLMQSAAHFGLPNELTPRVCYELAVCLAKELKTKEKRKSGAPATWQTGSGAMVLAAEIQALMKVPNARKGEVIKWLHGEKRYRQIKFETFRVGCYAVVRKYGNPH